MFHNFSNSSNGGNDNEYYDILGVKKDANTSEIKKAYHKLARKYHPDKASSDKKEEYTKKFQSIGEAYEILSDEEKRKIYDQYGKKGLENPGSGANPFDIFSQFFGGGGNGFNSGGFSRSQTQTNNSFSKRQPKKSAPVSHVVNISLEDLFNGKTIKLKITKKTIFDKNGKSPCDINDLEKTWHECSECDGYGMKTEVKQIAPGFITQQQSPCRSCLGTGEILKNQYELRDHPEIVQINIIRGMDPRSEQVIPGMGNCYPGTIPGDIIISFNVIPHDYFTLQGNHLIMNKTILLSEALCGLDFTVKHLDRTTLTLKTNDVIEPGMVTTVKGYGMYDKFGLRGDLKIQFHIEFPKNLLIHQKKNLRKYLPKPPSSSGGDNNNNNNNTIYISGSQ